MKNLSSRNPISSIANNIALRRVCGKYIILLNSDTVVEPSALSLMIDFLQSHPDAGMAGPMLLNSDGTIQLACRRSIPTPKVAFYKITGLGKLFPGNREFAKYNLTYRDPNKLQEVEAVSGACMMIKKKAMDEIGFLDERFFMYGEDLDWCYRLGKKGWKIYYIPDARVIHHHRASSKKRRFRSTLNFYHAMYIFYRKHFSNGKISPMNFFVMAGIGALVTFSLISNIFKGLPKENYK
ncbi:MAG: glycosyltransferase family 2 protein [Actinobacteria bacterium]|nr:glycosyltransferase family 2 protein [Actinomycetota bacterium]